VTGLAGVSVGGADAVPMSDMLAVRMVMVMWFSSRANSTIGPWHRKCGPSIGAHSSK
jgi:hypothetical protein